MEEPMDDLKTYRAWTRAGRGIVKGSKATHFVVNPDHLEARALFHRDQTCQLGEADIDELEGWSDVITAEEWDEIKAAKRRAKGAARAKLRKPASRPGSEVWCGPDKELIDLLRNAGFKFQPASKYWYHPGKDPEVLARGLVAGKIRGQHVQVDCDWRRAELPTL
jgi:hypothetical protein